MTRLKEAEQYRAEMAACPDLTGHSRGELAEQGVRDALSLVGDVRDIDPQAVWGRLAGWAVRDVVRLVAATVALAALVDPEVNPKQALAWTNGLARTAA